MAPIRSHRYLSSYRYRSITCTCSIDTYELVSFLSNKGDSILRMLLFLLFVCCCFAIFDIDSASNMLSIRSPTNCLILKCWFGHDMFNTRKYWFQQNVLFVNLDLLSLVLWTLSNSTCDFGCRVIWFSSALVHGRSSFAFLQETKWTSSYRCAYVLCQKSSVNPL